MIKVLLLALMFLAAVTSKVEDTSNSAEGQVSSNTKVVDGDTDTVGRRLLLNEKELVSDVDNAISEERRRLSGCQDNSNGHCDSFGDCCPEYNNHKYWCGNYDTATFKSNQMCCACGGGINKGKARVQLKTTNSFVKIFDDDGTGAARDGSLWKPNKNKPWFGAVASDSYSSASHMEGVYAESDAFGMLKEPAYWQQIWNARAAEQESSLEENNFNDRGDTTLNRHSTYEYTLYNGYVAQLTGWTHTRNYAKGFLTNAPNTNPQVKIRGLLPGKKYAYKIYQYASSYPGTTGFTAPGANEIITNQQEHVEPTASGSFTSDSNGEALFQFRKTDDHVHLSAISIARDCEGNDRSLWKAIPHDGYVCLGHVGIGHGGCGTGRHFSNGHTVRNHHFPNYRCVKKEYVVRIHTEDLHRVWYDRGSGANDDASLWNYLSPNGYTLAFANRNHNRPSGPFYDFAPTLF